jgi:hypothetical protein
VLLYIPIYNVDGASNRGTSSRVNQVGPEAFGFRGNARHLDLNRDFIKADSLNARAFAALFTRWDPDVMVDTHTSNGADYQHVMTLIATQPDKLGGRAGTLLRSEMLPWLYEAMAERGFPMCPYVNPLKETPDDGIADFLDSPRFSTGYAALHHTVGFMPETHMLKPFDMRYRSMRAFGDSTLAYTAANGDAIRAARAADRAAINAGTPVWRIVDFRKHPLPFEVRRLHQVVQVQAESIEADAAQGDWLIPLGGTHDRFIIEVLEPQGLDSHFRWAFFDSILDKKEGFSDYAFEDETTRLLDEEPGLRERFEAWRAADPSLLSDAHAVLDFVFRTARRYAEPAWERYPVLRLPMD